MIYTIWNGQLSQQNTSGPLKVATGTGLKTMLQLKPLVPCRIIEWGVSFDASASATPGYVELFQSDVAATVTAFVNGDISQVDAEARKFGDPTSNYISVGTSASGFTASAEGSTTVVNNLDGPKLIAPTNQYEKQFPLGQEGWVEANKFARIRVLFGATVNMLCYMKIAF